MLPDIPSDLVYLDDTIIPVLLHTSLFIHSATPYISFLLILQSHMLMFGWLTITDAVQGKGSCLESVAIVLCFCYDVVCG